MFLKKSKDPFLVHFSSLSLYFLAVTCLCCKFLLADDNKHVSFVEIGQELVHDLNEVMAWSKRKCLPLNVETCLVLHYSGRLQSNPCNDYFINGVLLLSSHTGYNLGLTCTAVGHYYEHIATICAKVSRHIWLALRLF